MNKHEILPFDSFVRIVVFLRRLSRGGYRILSTTKTVLFVTKANSWKPLTIYSSQSEWKKGLIRNKLQEIFFVFFGIVYVSGTYSEKFTQIGPGRFLQYKIFYGLLDMHIFGNISEVKIVSDILFSFS